MVFAVRSVQIDYLRPALFNEMIGVSAEVVQVKKTSLIFDQAITRGDTLLCKGFTRIACLDSETFRPKAIPEPLIRAVNE